MSVCELLSPARDLSVVPSAGNSQARSLLGEVAAGRERERRELEGKEKSKKGYTNDNFPSVAPAVQSLQWKHPTPRPSRCR